MHISRVTCAHTISQMICFGGISNRNGKITVITRISAKFKLLEVSLFFNKYRSHLSGTILWLICWWAGTLSSNVCYCFLYHGPTNTSCSLTGVSRDSAAIQKRFYTLFTPVHMMLPKQTKIEHLPRDASTILREWYLTATFSGTTQC